MANDRNHPLRDPFSIRAGGVIAGISLIVMMGVGQAAFAQPIDVTITEVFVDDPVFDQMTIIGQDFDSGNSLEVTLGEFPDPLVIVSEAADEIVVELPALITEGDFLLRVTTGGGGGGGGGGRSDVYNLTIGSRVAADAVPTNAIILWVQNNTCPNGFARLAALDGRFLMASNVAGVTGGSNTHSHGAGTYTGAAHRHTLEPWNGSFPPVDDNSGGSDFNSRTDMAGGGTVTGASASTDSRPAFATVLLCRKT